MTPKYIIGGLIAIVFIIWGAATFLKTTVRYVSFEEARTATRIVQVVGGIDFDKVSYDADRRRLVFSIYDLNADNPETAARLKIIYEGIVPSNFEQATSVLVRGKPGPDGFMAKKILVKCPSKYQGLAPDSKG